MPILLCPLSFHPPRNIPIKKQLTFQTFFAKILKCMHCLKENTMKEVWSCFEGRGVFLPSRTFSIGYIEGKSKVKVVLFIWVKGNCIHKLNYQSGDIYVMIYKNLKVLLVFEWNLQEATIAIYIYVCVYLLNLLWVIKENECSRKHVLYQKKNYVTF